MNNDLDPALDLPDQLHELLRELDQARAVARGVLA